MTPEELFTDRLQGNVAVVDFKTPIVKLMELSDLHTQNMNRLGSRHVSKEMKAVSDQYEAELSKIKHDLGVMLLTVPELHDDLRKMDIVTMSLEEIFETFDFQLYVKRKS